MDYDIYKEVKNGKLRLPGRLCYTDYPKYKTKSITTDEQNCLEESKIKRRRFRKRRNRKAKKSSQSDYTENQDYIDVESWSHLGDDLRQADSCRSLSVDHMRNHMKRIQSKAKLNSSKAKVNRYLQKYVAKGGAVNMYARY
jgi:hypothetical protein